MATEVVVYTIVHQPRRLKLPAQPIPCGASVEDMARCVFDDAMNERYFHKVANTCYYPASELMLRLVRQGMKLAIGFSVSFLRQAADWDPALLARFRELVAQPNVELIGVEPYHSFVFLLDLPLFIERMRWMSDEMERVFGKRPRITDTTEMGMSASIYDALDQAGFDAAMMDGRQWVMGWREPTHVYHYGGQLRLFTRHLRLSDDVGYRFSDRSWTRFPLFADEYARWLRATRGDLILLGWDFETFGEHHRRESGIFDFLERLPDALGRRGVKFSTPGEALARWGARAHHLPLPALPTTWAGNGSMDFFLGNSAQQAVAQLMFHTLSIARLSGDPELVDLALWLAQSDNLHLIQWYGRSGPEAEVSAYFTPHEWWELGPARIIAEQQRVYDQVLRAMEYHLPGRNTVAAVTQARVPRQRGQTRSPSGGARTSLGQPKHGTRVAASKRGDGPAR
jgi:alpha-amylase